MLLFTQIAQNQSLDDLVELWMPKLQGTLDFVHPGSILVLEAFYLDLLVCSGYDHLLAFTQLLSFGDWAELLVFTLRRWVVQRDHCLLLVFHRLAVRANIWLLFHHFLSH